MQPSPSRMRARPPDYALTGPPRVHCGYGPTTRPHPPGEVVEGLQDQRFPSGPALPATGLPILTPAGLAPAGHISLSWTHNRTGTFQRIRLSSKPFRAQFVDVQGEIDVAHLTLLTRPSDPGLPGPLRLGFLPCGRLSRPLTTTGPLLPWGSRPVGNPAFRALLTFRMG
jgi:hypothetical protein